MKNTNQEEMKPTESKNVDDTKETVHTFLDKIALAQSNGDEWIETTPEIIAHYNRKGLNGAKFFIFNGIKVCETGKLETIEEEINEQMGHKVFGKEEGVILGRT